MKYFLTHSMQLEDGLLKQRAKIVLAHASSGHKRAVEQLIANPDMSTILANVKATEDVSFARVVYIVTINHLLCVFEGESANGILLSTGRRCGSCLLRL